MATDLLSRTRHLDLGCGDMPRNPYRRDELHGIDIFPRHEPGHYEIRKANLSLEPIPYPDHDFDSISAYDFFEHIPRVCMTADGRATRFPLPELEYIPADDGLRQKFRTWNRARCNRISHVLWEFIAEK